PVALASGIPRSPVLSVAQTGDGAAWLGTRGAGLFRLENGKTLLVSKGMPDSKVNSLLPDGARDLWIGTDHGLALWNGMEVSTPGVPAALKNIQVLATT